VDPPPYEKCPICGAPLKGTEDVFDTWVDSSISPLYNTFWARDEDMFKKLYPMSLRPQSHDIIRTWAFYTILRCKTVTGEKPWNDIFIDGFILAPDGRPMHTSWGNVVDPLEIIDEYGSDALRFFAAKCTPGEDTPFRYKDTIRGRKVVIKLYNLGKFVRSAIKDGVREVPKEELKLMDRWIISKYSQVVKKVTEEMDNYRYDRAIKEVENFMWNVFADHYVEMVKHRLNEDATKYTLYHVFLGIIKMFAPIMPHITEEVYQEHYREFVGEKSIHLTSWPEEMFVDPEALEEGEKVKEVIASIRAWKNETRREIREIVVEGIRHTEDIAGTFRCRVSTEIEGEVEEIVSAVQPNFSVIGPKFREKAKDIIKFIKSADPQRLWKEIQEGTAECCGTKITEDMVKVQRSKRYRGEEVAVLNVGDVMVLII
jgi:valyl-tRNA synthetase